MNFRDMFRLPKVVGEIGIEIEIEGNRLPTVNNKYWHSKRDGSLRGEALEYVLTAPIDRKDLDNAMALLTGEFRTANSTLIPSERCGVHVHLNVQEYTPDELMKFATLYLILEEILVKYCGSSREGNLFCLRVQDAEYIISSLIRARRINAWNELTRDNIRYAAINFTAIRKYGSVEFRSMRTDKDLSTVKEWTLLLLALKDRAAEFSSTQAIVEGFSSIGAKAFLHSIFGDMAKLLYCRNMDELLMQGIRRTQDLAYSSYIGPNKNDKEYDAKIKALVDKRLRNQALGRLRHPRIGTLQPTLNSLREIRERIVNEMRGTTSLSCAIQYCENFPHSIVTGTNTFNYLEGDILIQGTDLYQIVGGMIVSYALPRGYSLLVFPVTNVLINWYIEHNRHVIMDAQEWAEREIANLQIEQPDYMDPYEGME